jgi:hypothetical protein
VPGGMPPLPFPLEMPPPFNDVLPFTWLLLRVYRAQQVFGCPRPQRLEQCCRSPAATGPWRRTQSQTGMLAGSATRLKYARARITESPAPAVIGQPRHTSIRRRSPDAVRSSSDRLRA